MVAAGRVRSWLSHAAVGLLCLIVWGLTFVMAAVRLVGDRLATPLEEDPTLPWQLNPEVPEYAADDLREELRERYRRWKRSRPWCWLPMRWRQRTFVWWGIGDLREGVSRLKEIEETVDVNSQRE